MDKLQGMTVFVKAADAGSFTAAGAALDMSAQMVGKHVSGLEEHLGAKLLNRTTRRQSLTEAGRLFYERCRVVLTEVEAAEAVAQDLTATPRGKLRITAPMTFGTYSLMPIITRYMQSYPDVQVDLVLTDRFVDLVDEGFDAAVRLGPLANSSLIARPLPRYRLVACAAPAYLEKHGTPETPADLTALECLVYTYVSRQPKQDWQFTKDGRTTTVEVKGRLQVNDSRALLGAARAGLGMIRGAEAMVREDLEAGRLVRLLPDYEGMTRELHVLFSADRYLPPKLRSFVDFVAAELEFRKD